MAAVTPVMASLKPREIGLVVETPTAPVEGVHEVRKGRQPLRKVHEVPPYGLPARSRMPAMPPTATTLCHVSSAIGARGCTYHSRPELVLMRFAGTMAPVDMFWM